MQIHQANIQASMRFVHLDESCTCSSKSDVTLEIYAVPQELLLLCQPTSSSNGCLSLE